MPAENIDQLAHLVGALIRGQDSPTIELEIGGEFSASVSWDSEKDHLSIRVSGPTTQIRDVLATGLEPLGLIKAPPEVTKKLIPEPSRADEVDLEEATEGIDSSALCEGLFHGPFNAYQQRVLLLMDERWAEVGESYRRNQRPPSREEGTPGWARDILTPVTGGRSCGPREEAFTRWRSFLHGTLPSTPREVSFLVGGGLADARLVDNLQQEEAAGLWGVSRSTTWAWECGKNVGSSKTLAKLLMEPTHRALEDRAPLLRLLQQIADRA